MWITILQGGDGTTEGPRPEREEGIRNSRRVIRTPASHWNVLIDSPTLIVAASSKYSNIRPHIWIAIKQ